MATNPDKEAELTFRMEQIRKRNAELQKRHEEVKADKLNAEMLSNEFQEKHRPTSGPEDTELPRQVREHVSVKSRLGPIQTERKAQIYRQPQTRQAKAPPAASVDGDTEEKESENGPPPDPKYSFLSDRSRDNDFESPSNNSSKRDNSRRHPTNYGGKNFENVKTNIEKRREYERNSYRGPPRNKMEMSLSMTGRERRQYEVWKTERNEIESERMNRQKTSNGQWKREWDKNKNKGEIEELDAPYGSRTNRRDFESNWHRGSKDQRNYKHFEQEEKKVQIHVNINSGTDTRRVSVPEEKPTDKAEKKETELQDYYEDNSGGSWADETEWEESGQWEECFDDPDEPQPTYLKDVGEISRLNTQVENLTVSNSEEAHPT